MPFGVFGSDFENIVILLKFFHKFSNYNIWMRKMCLKFVTATISDAAMNSVRIRKNWLVRNNNLGKTESLYQKVASLIFRLSILIPKHHLPVVPKMTKTIFQQTFRLILVINAFCKHVCLVFLSRLDINDIDHLSCWVIYQENWWRLVVFSLHNNCVLGRQTREK